MSTTVEVSARSDIGLLRRVNEDTLIARDPLFIVADGMGGHARGDAASQEAIRVLSERFAENQAPTPDDVLAAIEDANRAVRGLSAVDDTGASVAGTTLTGLVRVHPEAGGANWMVVNVGDSRVYAWDGGALNQLSVDHSAVQELLDSGAITAAEAVNHPEGNVITRALGADDEAGADSWLFPITGRQAFLICSDGLTKELDDRAIARVLADSDANEADPADALVEAALAAGGRDNVSVIVIHSATDDAPHSERS